MSMRNIASIAGVAGAAALALALSGAAFAEQGPNLGKPIAQADFAKWNIDVEPSGVLFTTAEILPRLHDRDWPWPEYPQGKPIIARQAAALLRPLGLSTNQTVRRRTVTGMLLALDDRRPAFQRGPVRWRRRTQPSLRRT